MIMDENVVDSAMTHGGVYWSCVAHGLAHGRVAGRVTQVSNPSSFLTAMAHGRVISRVVQVSKYALFWQVCDTGVSGGRVRHTACSHGHVTCE
ncbi:Metal-nicotianamine transporter YSL2 -like protein [Gossypium arboreum]|uniref:Metal-nicotianamine transporter YSL2-like protein n=1 Tax=Gossypium arboreum TaxID=29729 RepID=A0A0B0MQL5_GOSAR|nr:Metal-nicotianamine transporter YSL2 -like protein [Gossypium arboreum]